MGLFHRPYREGAGRPVPREGLRRLLVVSGTYFWKLVGANLLFVLFSLPLITLPAALCALNRVCLLIYREGSCFLWLDFRQEFLRSFRRSLLPAALFGALIFVGYFFMSLGAANGIYPVWCMVFWSLGIISAAAGLGWGTYFFVLVPLLNQKNPAVLKNAALLCMIRPSRMLSVLALVLVMTFAAAALMPVFVVALLLFWFAAAQMPVCYLVNEVAEEYILRPHRERQKNTM